MIWWLEYALPVVVGIIWRGGLVGGSVSLCRWTLSGPGAQALPSVEESVSWLPLDRVENSPLSQHAVCLDTAILSNTMIMD